jgi:hypothetical protein
VIWEPACGDGAISRILEAAGHEVISTDLVDRGYGRGGHDFLTDHTTRADHVVTNPDYKRSRQFVEHALSRIPEDGTVCMLLPVRWEAAQSRRHLMALCYRKWVLSRRPEMHRGGYSGKRHSPQLDCAWYVFRRDHTGPTQTVVLPPDCGEESPPLLRSEETTDPPPLSAALALPAGPAMPSHLPPPFGSAAEIASRRCFLCGVANPCHSWGPPLVPPGRIVWGCAACRADIEGPLTAGRWPTPRPRR